MPRTYKPLTAAAKKKISQGMKKAHAKKQRVGIPWDGSIDRYIDATSGLVYRESPSAASLKAPPRYKLHISDVSATDIDTILAATNGHPVTISKE
jgi:hypothetical protein